MYKSILVPVDLGHPGRMTEALKVAKQVAGPDTEIRLVSVVEDLPLYLAAEMPTGLFDKGREKVRAQLDKIAEGLGKNAHSEVRNGSVYKAILNAASELGSDLIIVGSHKPGAQDYLLGSTAARVVRHAQCSVMVVR